MRKEFWAMGIVRTQVYRKAGAYLGHEAWLEG